MKQKLMIGIDPSWSGLGWCICNEAGPIVVGHAKNLSSSWKWDKLRVALADLDDEISAVIASGDYDKPRVVIETAPPVYSRRKNQAVIGQALGQINGSIALWATRPGVWEYPWTLTPKEWRAWWGIRGGRGQTRKVLKNHAIRTARMLDKSVSLRNDLMLSKWQYSGDDGGALGDVAEAMLIGVGAARRFKLAPKGPSPQRNKQWRTK